MLKKYKNIKFKRFLKQYLYRSFELDHLESCQFDSLHTLLDRFLRRNNVYNLVKQLDEETYLCLWSFLLDLKEKYPFMFSDYKEDD